MLHAPQHVDTEMEIETLPMVLPMHMSTTIHVTYSKIKFIRVQSIDLFSHVRNGREDAQAQREDRPEVNRSQEVLCEG